jgi:hypothetical protein
MKSRRRKFGEKKNGSCSLYTTCFLAVIISTTVLVLFYLKLFYQTVHVVLRGSLPTETDSESLVLASSRDAPGQPEVTATREKKRVPFVKQDSQFAYVTLISGIDESFRYRGFLYNSLIMKRALKLEGSSADFIALIGFSQNDTTPFDDDIDLLSSHGIIVHILPRLLNPSLPLGFAVCASIDSFKNIFFHNL